MPKIFNLENRKQGDNSIKQTSPNEAFKHTAFTDA
jgi:hypothetical protein